MIRLLIRLTIVALMAHAAWRIGSAYVSLYEFKDAIREASQFEPDKSDAGLRGQILTFASRFDVPVGEDDFSVRRENGHTYTNGSYTMSLEVLPRYRYPWSFTWNTDTVKRTRS